MMRTILCCCALVSLLGGVALAETWTILKPDGPGGWSRGERETMTLEEAERGAREATEAQRQAAEETRSWPPSVGPGGREMEWTVLEPEDGSGGRGRLVRERATLEQALDAASGRSEAAPGDTGTDTGRIAPSPDSAADVGRGQNGTLRQRAGGEEWGRVVREIEPEHEAEASHPGLLDRGYRVVPYSPGGRVIYGQESGVPREP